MKPLLFVLSLLTLFACSTEPKPIHFGEDGCSYCKMTISDVRYAGELLTNKGKEYKFDSIECMAAYILEKKKGSEDIHSLWTIKFNEPEKLIDARAAWYLHSKLLKSPMGLNLSSFETRATARSTQDVYPGDLIKWDEVKTVVKERWLD